MPHEHGHGAQGFGGILIKCGQLAVERWNEEIEIEEMYMIRRMYGPNCHGSFGGKGEGVSGAVTTTIRSGSRFVTRGHSRAVAVSSHGDVSEPGGYGPGRPCARARQYVSCGVSYSMESRLLFVLVSLMARWV